MRHGKKRHKLGVTGPHRLALLANLSVGLITHGKIKTTLAKAKALRPFVEKVITLAKKAESSNDAERKLHFRRLAIARLNNPEAVATLFDKRVEEFMERPGGYTRIYKLGQRIGDAAEMGLIELIDGNDEGYEKRPSRKAPAKSVKEATHAPEKEGSTESDDETAAEPEAQTEEPVGETVEAKKAVEAEAVDTEVPENDEADSDIETTEAVSETEGADESESEDETKSS